jgi:RNA polymerase sigma-70 factor, ECF subfamily
MPRPGNAVPPRDRSRRGIGWLRGQPATEARAAARGVDRGRNQPGAQFFVDPLAGPANLTAPTAVFFAVCAAMTRAIPGQPATTTHPSKPTEDVRAVDLELAQRCRHGDAAAFEELYRAHAGRLYNLVFRMVGSAQEAEDLLQDVFLNAYRKLGSFRGDSSLGTWLYRLAVNQCLDVLRGRQSKMARVTDSLDDDGAAEPAAVSPVVPTAVSRLDLDRAIARLPQGCRAAFILHDVEGFEHNEVAKLLGVSEGTSKSQVHKARMKLRGMLSGTAQ